MAAGRRQVVASLGFSVPALITAGLVCLGYCHVVHADGEAGEGAPKVTITAPKNGSSAGWNTLVRYSVVVSYQGKSTQYQELPARQVVLTATYLPDVSAAEAKPAAATPAGLLGIVRSDCLGCHQFDAKAMGPSFTAIAGRYPQSPITIEAISGHIRNGCSGLWGQQSMPPHPQLTDEEAQAIARWITESAADPAVHYYAGTDGAIRMTAVGTPGAKAGMLLRVSYTSPAAHHEADEAGYGEASVIIRGN